jgi:hypothetical protein
MATLLGALESMKAKLEEDDVKSDDTELEAAMIAVMEAEQEVEASNTEIMELDGVVEEAEEAIGRLEGIRDAILEYGISKSMMKAADPQGELCAAGIVASYEELEDTPVKDENAEAAAEGIMDQIKKIWNKLKEIFAAIWNKLKSWASLVMRGFRSYETLLKAMTDKVAAIAVDEAELDKVEASVVTKAEFITLNKAVDTIADAPFFAKMSGIYDKLEKAVEDKDADKEKIKGMVDEANKFWGDMVDASVTDATGLKFNEYGSIERGKAKIVRKNQTMQAAGWSGSEIIRALKNAHIRMHNMKAAETILKQQTEIAGGLSKMFAAQMQKIKGMASEEGRRRNAALNGAKTVANNGRKLIQVGIYEAGTVAKIAITLGKAALKAKKK